MKKDEKKYYAYWLCGIPAVGNRTIERLSEVFGTPEMIYYASDKEWARVVNKTQLEEMKKHKEKWELQGEYEKLQKQGIQFLVKEDKEYPERLRRIPDAPFGIFVKGRLPEETGISVAVIGARDCSEYGRYVAQELGRVLGENRIQVISGMARGIDSISQEAAIKAGGTSVAVLGNGVDICYPAQSRSLYECIQTKGCLLSGYPPGTAPRPQNFPPRNRIVSGLADVVVVVEARSKSGTLITVDMALEQGKEVYVVPGRVTDRLSDGCNRLLKQGAGILLSPEEFLGEIGELVERQQGMRGRMPDTICVGNVEECDTARHGAGIHDNADGFGIVGVGMEQIRKVEVDQKIPCGLQEIYEVLDLYPRSLEEILSCLPGTCSVQEINSALMRLCLGKWAIQVSPGYFVRNHQTIINSENVLKK